MFHFKYKMVQSISRVARMVSKVRYKFKEQHIKIVAEVMNVLSKGNCTWFLFINVPCVLPRS